MSVLDLLGIIFYLLGYAVFLFSIFRHTYIRLGYTLGLFVFLTLQYGPHTVLFPGMLEISINAYNDSLNFVYSILLGFVFFVLGGMFLIAPAHLVVGIRSAHDPVYFTFENFLFRRSRILMLMLFLVFLSIVFQKGIGITLEHIRYLSGSSVFTYTEVRREIFSGSAWAKYTDLVRFSIVPFVYTCLIVMGFISVKLRSRLLFFFGAVAVALLVSIQMNKFFYLYFFVVTALVYISYKFFPEGCFETRFIARMIPVVMIILIFFLFIVLIMYRVQYEAALDQGLIDMTDITETLLFRVFFASSDSLRLWIDYFGFQGEYKGIGVIGKLCFLSDECFNANTFIPYYYMGRELTSMQAGFLGTALGVGGWLAIPIITFLLAGVVFLNNWVLSKFNSIYWVYCVGPIMFLNSFFLTTRELHTALLSGGAVSLALVMIFLIRNLGGK